jgi:hypothetical protein
MKHLDWFLKGFLISAIICAYFILGLVLSIQINFWLLGLFILSYLIGRISEIKN